MPRRHRRGPLQRDMLRQGISNKLARRGLEGRHVGVADGGERRVLWVQVAREERRVVGPAVVVDSRGGRVVEDVDGVRGDGA